MYKRQAKKSGNARWAYDCYRRFIQMYSDVVMEVGKKYFEELIDEMKEKRGVTQDTELTADDLKELAEQFKAEYKEKIGSDFPSDPKEQLMGAVKMCIRDRCACTCKSTRHSWSTGRVGSSPFSRDRCV